MQSSAPNGFTNPRTTCIYDPPARQVLVTTPTGQRCTFPYDPDGSLVGALKVSTAGVTWTVDRGDKATGGAYRDVNGGADAVKFDTCGNRRLANVAGARTTIMCDAVKPGPTGCAGAGRTRFVFEPKGTQPIVLVFLPISLEWPVYLTFLEVSRFRKQRDWDAAQQAFGEVLEHKIFRSILNGARGKVLNGTQDPGAWDDVPQGAIERLLEWQKLGRLRYKDKGPYKFVGWLGTVCFRACFEAWVSELHWRPPNLFLVGNGQLAEMIEVPKWGRRIERLLLAIEELPNPATRDILLEIIFGVKIEDAAKKRGISVATMHSRRQEAVDMLCEADIDFPEYL